MIVRPGGTPGVLLVDDHPSYRAGLRAMLESDGIDVVGEAGDGRQAIELARARHPDVVVMDLSMPLRSGIETAQELLAGQSGLKVLILSASAAEADVRRAIAAGAIGYLLKDTSADLLVSAIRQVAAGNAVLSGGIAGLVLDAVRTPKRARSEGEDQASLTARELEVLRLIAEGAANDAIGQMLFISPNTVKQHVANIAEKLGAHSRAQAAAQGVRSGLI